MSKVGNTGKNKAAVKPDHMGPLVNEQTKEFVNNFRTTYNCVCFTKDIKRVDTIINAYRDGDINLVQYHEAILYRENQLIIKFNEWVSNQGVASGADELAYKAPVEAEEEDDQEDDQEDDGSCDDTPKKKQQGKRINDLLKTSGQIRDIESQLVFQVLPNTARIILKLVAMNDTTVQDPEMISLTKISWAALVKHGMVMCLNGEPPSAESEDAIAVLTRCFRSMSKDLIPGIVKAANDVFRKKTAVHHTGRAIPIDLFNNYMFVAATSREKFSEGVLGRLTLLVRDLSTHRKELKAFLKQVVATKEKETRKVAIAAEKLNEKFSKYRSSFPLALDKTDRNRRDKAGKAMIDSDEMTNEQLAELRLAEQDKFRKDLALTIYEGTDQDDRLAMLGASLMREGSITLEQRKEIKDKSLKLKKMMEALFQSGATSASVEAANNGEKFKRLLAYLPPSIGSVYKALVAKEQVVPVIVAQAAPVDMDRLTLLMLMKKPPTAKGLFDNVLRHRAANIANGTSSKSPRPDNAAQNSKVNPEMVLAQNQIAMRNAATNGVPIYTGTDEGARYLTKCSKFFSDRVIDLAHRVMDKNKDGVINLSEMVEAVLLAAIRETNGYPAQHDKGMCIGVGEKYNLNRDCFALFASTLETDRVKIVWIRELIIALMATPPTGVDHFAVYIRSIKKFEEWVQIRGDVVLKILQGCKQLMGEKPRLIEALADTCLFAIAHGSRQENATPLKLLVEQQDDNEVTTRNWKIAEDSLPRFRSFMKFARSSILVDNSYIDLLSDDEDDDVLPAAKKSKKTSASPAAQHAGSPPVSPPTAAATASPSVGDKRRAGPGNKPTHRKDLTPEVVAQLAKVVSSIVTTDPLTEATTAAGYATVAATQARARMAWQTSEGRRAPPPAAPAAAPVVSEHASLKANRARAMLAAQAQPP